MSGSGSVIDLFSAPMSSDFVGSSGTLLVSLMAVDNWGTQALGRDIVRLSADSDNLLSIGHSSDGTITFSCRFGGTDNNYSPSEAALSGTSDNPVPAAFAITWDSDQIEYYMSAAPTSALPFGAPLRKLSTLATSGAWAGTPSLFLLGAQTSDGAIGALKAGFTGCALWNRVVDPRRMCPVNHHLTWYPDFIMSVGSTSDGTTSDIIGYWPLNEGSGTAALEWGQTPMYFKFTGRLKSIQPDSGRFGSSRVAVTALDWLDDAATYKIQNTPTQVDVTADKALLSVIRYAASQPQGVILATGAETLSFTTYDTSKGVTVLSEIGKITASEFGYAYMRGTVNSEGIPGMTFANESRHTRLLNTTPAFLLTDDGTSDAMRSISPSQDIAALKNVVEIVTHPADVDTDNVTVTSLPTGTVLQVPPGGTFIYTVKYLDSDQAFRVVGVSSLVAPVQNTDFIINSNSAGTGTDLTDDYRVTMLATSAGNLLAYYTMADGASGILRNEQDNTGLKDAFQQPSSGGSTSSAPSVSGASGGSGGSATSGGSPPSTISGGGGGGGAVVM